MFSPILAHAGNLLVLPFLVGAIVVIMIALKDGTHRRSSMSRLPSTPMGRQIRAAMRVATPPRREAASVTRPMRTAPPAVRLVRAEAKVSRPVPTRWGG